MNCDCCLRSNVTVRPFVMDDNAEVMLCRTCAAKVRKEAELKPID